MKVTREAMADIASVGYCFDDLNEKPNKPTSKHEHIYKCARWIERELYNREEIEVNIDAVAAYMEHGELPQHEASLYVAVETLADEYQKQHPGMLPEAVEFYPED